MKFLISKVVISSLTVCCSLGAYGFRVGEEVMTDNYVAGTIVQLHRDGTALLAIGGTTTNAYTFDHRYRVENLWPIQSCVKGICRGDQVMTDDRQEGIVVETYKDEKVLLSIGGKTMNRFGHVNRYSVENLKKTQSRNDSCVGDFCRGDQLITDDYQEGVVIETYANGKVLLSINGKTWDARYNRNLYGSQTLSRVQPCFESFCQGDRVTTDDYRKGIVVRVYWDGRVLVLINGKTWDSSYKTNRFSVRTLSKG